jgi:hypothetical protein
MNQPFGTQIERIHQNSLFQGGSQFDNAQLARIQQNTISGEEANPLRAGFGGGFSNPLSNQAMGGGYNQGVQQGFQQGYQQGVTQQQLQRIHNNSLFQGASQYDDPQVQRIHAASMQAGTMAAPQLNVQGFGGGISAGGFGTAMNMGGGFNQSFSNQALGNQAPYNAGALRAMMSADAGIRDAEGPDRYPASMYTGSNQYDNINQSVFNQMMGR